MLGLKTEWMGGIYRFEFGEGVSFIALNFAKGVHLLL